MYTSIYIWHLRQDVPLVMSHPILSHPIPSCMGQLMAIGAGLGQLVHMVHQCIQAYIWHLRQNVPLVPSQPILSQQLLEVQT